MNILKTCTLTTQSHLQQESAIPSHVYIHMLVAEHAMHGAACSSGPSFSLNDTLNDTAIVEQYLAQGHNDVQTAGAGYGTTFLLHIVIIYIYYTIF